MDSSNQLSQAQRHIADGEWEAAAATLSQLLCAAPESVDGLNLYGLALRQLHRPAEALACLRKAMGIAGPHPVILTNLGTTLEDLGEFAQAERCYRMAGQAAPEMPEAAFNLGRLLFKQNRYPEAEQAFDLATRAGPNDPDAWNSLGAVVNQLGKRSEAIACFEKALAVEPGHLDALINLASVLVSQPRSDSLHATAAAYCQRAIDAAPEDPRCWNLHGLLSQKTGQHAAAERSYRHAVALQAGFAPALSNLGHLLTRRGGLEEAATMLEEAARIAPENPDVINNLGFLRMAQWRLHDAIGLFRAALAALPQGHEAARLNLGAALTRAGRMAEAVPMLAHCVAAMPNEPVAYDNLLMALLYEHGLPIEVLFSRHREYAAFFETNSGQKAAGYRPPRGPGVPLRVGFVSGDLRQHPVAHFLAPLIERLPAFGIETIAYNNSEASDALTERLRSAFSSWHDIFGLSDEAAAALVSKQVDVLIDLSGHTAGNRLGIFIRRPAPVQVNWLGYPATSGLRCFDWRIVDGITDPPGSEAWHVERLFRLPGCFLAFRPPDNSPPVAPRTNRDFITFGCFNTLAKISEACRLAWVEILARLPTARLVLKAKAFADAVIAAETLDWFGRQGIDPHRVSLLGWQAESGSHLDLYNTIDIALDPFPYAGTTTTCESLWMGVPVITLAGQIHSERVGASLLSTAQLQDWVATGIEDYVALAVDWAERRSELCDLKRRLRDQMLASPLCEADVFARTFAAALNAMHTGLDKAADEMLPTANAAAACLRTLPEDVAIYVPDSLNQITNYVLLERGDWFEDEIRFLRDICHPGQNCIDVGANYGVYALSLASRCGPSGKVVAIEPSPGTAAMLRESIRHNAFVNVEVIEAAASNQRGRTRLSVFGNSELNRVAAGSEGIEVASVCLDDLDSGATWDVIKIDAEGHELAVLQGAKELLRSQSPLVMLEVCADDRGQNFSPLQFLADLGYRSYRLISELGVLVPVEFATHWDPYWLNVFACKADRAGSLAAAGHLIGIEPPLAATPVPLGRAEAFGLVPALASFPTSLNDAAASAAHRTAIACYGQSTDRRLGIQVRHQSLLMAWELIRKLCQDAPTPPALSSFVRIAAAMNFRAEANLALEALLDRPLDGLSPEICLPADAGYDGLDQGMDFGAWLGAAALERQTKLKTWSTFYAGPELHANLVHLAKITQNNILAINRLTTHRARFLLP